MTEEQSVWVVHLTLPELSGFTLWGQPGESDDDRVLTSDGSALLFATQAALREFAQSDQTSDFASVDGYTAWRDGAEEDAEFIDIDLVEVAASLALPADEWDLNRSSEVVDGLNMLTDLAASLGAASIVERWSDGRYGALLDGLTFVTADDLPETVASLEPRLCLEGLLVDLATVASRSRVVA